MPDITVYVTRGQATPVTTTRYVPRAFGGTLVLITTTGMSSPVIATNIPVQLDTVNIDLILTSQGMIPTDSYDAYSEWTTYIPQRGDYLIDQTSGASYQVFGNPAVYFDHWEVRVTKYLGTTP